MKRTRVVGQILRWLFLPVRRLSLALARRTAPTRSVQGIELIDIERLDAQADQTAALEAALTLIASHDPRRFRRLQRYMPRIAVGVGGSFAYSSDLRTCFVPSDYATRPVPLIACLLVHESTHARLFRRGFAYGEEIRPRIERACIEEEIAFARKLPNSEDLVAYAQRRLEGSFWKTDAELLAEREEEFRSNGMPEKVLAARRRMLGSDS